MYKEGFFDTPDEASLCLIGTEEATFYSVEEVSDPREESPATFGSSALGFGTLTHTEHVMSAL